MQNFNTRVFTLILILIINVSAFSQNHFFDKTEIDSLTFTKTRNQINQLPNSMFEKHTFKKSNNELPYRLLLPQNFNNHRKYPVIIALHNSSRIGNDNEKQLEHLSKIWIRPEIYDKYNSIVIVPQFNSRSSIYLKDETGILISKPSTDVKLVLDLLEETESNYKVDKSRISLVGYSMGASTAQNLINLSPKKFAAIVSVSAVPDFSNIKFWKKKSILLIHGENDIDNPYEGSEILYSRLKGNKKLFFKTYSNLNHHNITIPLLLSEEIPSWLFNQKK